MIKRELKTIMAHKGLMWAMIAVILIPFIYSFCFLTSAWDPYGNTGKIPVAVVNEDEPATLQGKTIQAGADTVAKLHDDDQLEWHFVSAKKAAKGLKDNRYYTVVTIPKDFSKDAATVLDANPKQMKLTYETNGSLNYVSEIISQVGVDRLNSQIKEKVTTAFVDELFGQIKTIGTKLKTAATGAKQLDTGILKYTDGVNQVNGGLTQLNDNVPALASGVQQLADGGTQLKDGMGQLQGKVPTLASGVGQLTDGGAQLKGGLSTLNSGLGQYTGGVDQVAGGLNRLNAQVPTLASGVNQLDAGINGIYEKVVKAKNPKTVTMAAGIKQLYDGIKSLKYYTLTQRNGNPDLPDAIAQMNTKMAKLLKTVQTQNTLMSSAFMNIDMGLDPSTFGVTAEQLGLPAGSKAYPLYHFEKAANTAKTTANTDFTALQTAISQTTDPTQKAALQAALAKFKTSYTAEETASTTQYQTAKGYLNYVKASLGNKTYDAEGDPTGLILALQTFSKSLTALNDEMSNPEVSKHTAYKDAVTQLDQGLADLNDAVNVDKTPATMDNMSLNQALTQMKNGLDQLKNNVPALSSGVAQLNNGGSQLTAKSGQLRGGASQLYNGSVQESAGLNTLNASVPTLASGVGQLNDGAGRLSTGLNQLNSQVPTLASGVKQLKSGSGQLVANNQQLTDGTSQLSSGLHDGYQQVAATKLTKLTSKMFAAPSQDVQKKYTNVKNYGAALAPYVLALALFIAIIIFNFAYPMKRQDGDGTSLLSWLGGKVLIGTLVAVAAALVEATLMLVIGLPVAHVFGFYAMTILFALSAMYLTQVLNLAFNRVGIFIALGLLTLSGSGGLFPAQTISPLYESTQKFLPMTYAINGYREAISGGIAGGTVVSSVFVLVIVALLSLILMIPAVGLQANWNHTSEND
ncbi:YhgE/Pip family protein [Lacticaseibacillus sp. N501-2]|uniref:YhgE/Pip family protein n=1 Tax=Lacticaseibacillus salsurae TaxID=3367729 RepID=UPI0038B3777B